jgi:hypothetical protein
VISIRPIITLVALCLLFTGCGSLGVRAWQREILSRREMLLETGAYDRALDDHIYFSKEGSSGGRGFAGGGCGCN